MPLTRIKNTAIGDGGISTAKLADGAVTTVKVADSAVNSAKIGVDVIVADDLAANSVTVSEITDGAVTGAKLADNLNYDSGTLYLDSTNNRVGIGTTSPSVNFHAKNASGNLEIRFDSDGARNIVFADNNGTYDAQIEAQANGTLYIATRQAQPIQFAVNNSEKMRIDSSGNLLVGTTSYDGSHFNDGAGGGFAVTSAGKIDMKVDGTVANFNRTNSSDGDILYFAKQGNGVGLSLIHI